MNTQLTVKELLEPLQTVIGVVEKKQTLPILSHVLIQLKDNQLTLTTTDMEIEIRASHPIQTQEEISFTIYAKDLIDIIRKLPETTIIEFIIVIHWYLQNNLCGYVYKLANLSLIKS